MIEEIVASLLGGLASSLFGDDESDVETTTAGYLDRLSEILKEHYQPYEDVGIRAMGQLEPQLTSLMKSPESLMNRIGRTYRQSPGYGYKTQEMIDASNKAAAAAGMLGSPSQQKLLSQDISGLADQDYYNYLQNALKLYALGLVGTTDLTQLGYNAASSLGENLANAQMSRANLAHEASMNKLNRERGMWGLAGNALGGALLGGFGGKGGGNAGGFGSVAPPPATYWTSSQFSPYGVQGYAQDQYRHGVQGYAQDQYRPAGNFLSWK